MTSTAQIEQTRVHSKRPGAAKGENPFWYLALGALLGFVLIRSEAASWYRIQEMFRFQSFHMYGVLFSAVLVAAASVALIRRFQVRTVWGAPIEITPKESTRGYNHVFGGVVFGLGWAWLGACPGPLFALAGTGMTVMLLALASAVVGAWTYGLLRARLPH